MPDAPVDLPAAELGAPASPDGQALREAMRRLASPVVVVTAEADGEPHGATIGSFTSVSLHPPLVSFNVTLGSALEWALRAGGPFAVHVLTAEQRDLAMHFARTDIDAAAGFALVAHHRVEGEPPLVDGTLFVLVCRPHARFEAGDHAILVGEVVRVEEGVGGQPLLYHASGYTTVQEMGEGR